MICSRPNCSCRIDPDKAVTVEGRQYCSETCVRECSDKRCVCQPCDCPQ